MSNSRTARIEIVVIGTRMHPSSNSAYDCCTVDSVVAGKLLGTNHLLNQRCHVALDRRGEI